MSDLALLRRKPLAPSTVPTITDMDVLLEAERELGYKPEVLRGQAGVIQQIEDEVKVQVAMDAIGLRPFDPVGVAHYKELQVQQIANKSAGSFVRWAHSSSGDSHQIGWWIAAGFTWLLVGLFSIAYFFGPEDHTWQQFFRSPLSWAWAVELTLTAWAGTISYARNKMAYKHRGEWLRESIKDYRKPIPEYALHTMVGLKKQLPQANFMVDHLEAEASLLERSYSPPKVYSGDPFLAMQYGSQTYYLEVWDEAKFEGKRLR
jgi:hypothetical protein